MAQNVEDEYLLKNKIAMFKNQLKITFRHLWRQRVFTALNILGLAIGISACWIIYRMVDFEYQHDRQIPDQERIFQLISKDKNDDSEEIGGFAGVPKPIIQVLLNDVSGAELVVPMFYQTHGSVKIAELEKTIEKNIQQVTTLPDYFDLLPYHWLAGSKTTALEHPDQLVLTDNRAREYFPELDYAEMIGKTLIYDDTVQRRVSGIVASLDFPNSFSTHNFEFILLRNDDLHNSFWGGMSSNDLVFIKSAQNINPEQITAQLNAINEKFNSEQFNRYKYKNWFELLPLKEKHFEVTYGVQTRAANKNVLYGLILVGGFLLILACINYINMSTALLPQRAREIGIRKSMGTTPAALVRQFVLETMLVVVMAFGFSFLLTLLARRVFVDFLPAGMFDYGQWANTGLFILALLLVISLLSGLYPAYLSTRVRTVNILKGQTSDMVGGGRLNLRKGLIVFQFMFAQVFIVCAIIIGQQLDFSLSKDLGFNKEAIITVDVPQKIHSKPENRGKIEVLKTEIQRNTDIGGVALGNRPMENSMWGNILKYISSTSEIQKQINMKFVDPDFIEVYQMQLIAGRNARPADTINELVINEAAIHAFGFSSADAALGQLLTSPNGDKSYPIVGVVRDFHQFGFQQAIPPGALITREKGFQTLNILLPEDREKWSSTLVALEKEWGNIYPEAAFDYKFYDEVIGSLYQSEQQSQTLVRAATAIVILISCLGLFGLATLTAYQRTKEIGIRKVLGATVTGIVGLLSRDFIKLVLIASIIASPIAWWAMSQWLEDFAYRIEIQWWTFAAGGLAAILIALFTVSWQAIRAAVANPVDSLRDE